jgi:hypothetical protein
MYLICKVIVITCLRDPKSLMEFEIRILIQSFKFLYSADQLAQSANCDNFIEWN